MLRLDVLIGMMMVIRVQYSYAVLLDLYIRIHCHSQGIISNFRRSEKLLSFVAMIVSLGDNDCHISAFRQLF